jgi:hypothetical protein
MAAGSGNWLKSFQAGKPEGMLEDQGAATVRTRSEKYFL